MRHPGDDPCLAPPPRSQEPAAIEHFSLSAFVC
jgi:hypothetical protein